MINLFLAAALLCPVSLPIGSNIVDVWAEYHHEAPEGGTYVYNGSQVALGPRDTHIVAEGHPWYVVASIHSTGLVLGQCSADPALLIDGFEAGTTEYWSKP